MRVGRVTVVPWWGASCLLLLQLSVRTTAYGAASVDKRNAATRPNIVILLADDLGFNDVGYHGSEIQTPAIDALAAEGVRLESFYTPFLCSPTRASLLTGRYPMRYGWDHLQPPLQGTAPVGVPLEETFLPERLRDEAGYRTAMLGKWHLGYYAREFLPVSRGFDTFLGFYDGWMNYYTHKSTLDRFDLHNDTSLPFAPGPNHPSFQCVTNLTMTYSMDIFNKEAVRIISQHDGDDEDHPLFMYMAFQAPHQPLQQVPSATYVSDKAYSNITNVDRRVYAGMVSALDEGVDIVVNALKAKGSAFWNNTVVFFLSDNGGDLFSGANNYPLRGGKGSLFEGGVRTVGFVHSPLLARPNRTETGLMHMVDVTATILSLAGLPADKNPTRNPPPPVPTMHPPPPRHPANATNNNNSSSNSKNNNKIRRRAQQHHHERQLLKANKKALPSSSSLPPLYLDGVDQWAMLSQGQPSARQEVLLDIDPYFTFGDLFVPYFSGGIRVGPWKLLVGWFALCSPQGNPPMCGWTDPTSRGTGPSSSFSLAAYTHLVPGPPPPTNASDLSSRPLTVALYHLGSDPNERQDVSGQHPDVVERLQARLMQHYVASMPPPVVHYGIMPEREGVLQASHARGECLAPWHDKPRTPPLPAPYR